VETTSKWTLLWIALAGGAVGSVVTWLIAYGARFWAARTEIDAHDRSARQRDEDLESWVADRNRVLEREIERITEWASGKDKEGNPRNLLWSGRHGVLISLAKEKALHQYRDQERQALRDVALLREREGLGHRFWRWVERRGPPELTAHHQVHPILDVWRAAVTRHDGEPLTPRDPTGETFQEAITYTQLNTKKFV